MDDFSAAVAENLFELLREFLWRVGFGGRGDVRHSSPYTLVPSFVDSVHLWPVCVYGCVSVSGVRVSECLFQRRFDQVNVIILILL